MADILKQIYAKVPEGQLADAVGNMFRITAQPGAAALIQSIGNGNLLNLIEANRQSAGTGVAQNIANEKKNTLQGLWAQVSSAFTEAILQAVENRQGGWAGMLAKVRDYLSKPETVEMLSHVVDLVENLVTVMGEFAKVYAKIYSMFPGLINGWMRFQLLMTQIGYLATPIIQLMSVLDRLRVGLFGASAATATTRTANGIAGGVAAMSGFAPRYNTVTTSAQYLAYNETVEALNKRKIAYERKSNILKNSIQLKDGTRQAISPLFFAPMSEFGKDPKASAAFFKERGRIMKLKSERNLQRNKMMSDRAAALAQIQQEKINAAKAERFEALRAVRRKDQMTNRALIDRYARFGGDAAIIASARAQIAERDACVAKIAEARHAARGAVGSDVRARFAQRYGWNKAAGMTLKTSFSAGRAMGALSIASMLGGLKSMALGLFSGLAKAIGLLVSPIGLVTAAIGGLAFLAYKFYSDSKKRKEQIGSAKENSKWITEANNNVNQMYLQTGTEVGGFGFVKAGYEKKMEDVQQAYSLGDNEIVSALIDDDKTNMLYGHQILKNYVGDFKYLPDYLTSDYYRRYGDSENVNVNTKAQDSARKIGVVAQWAKMATEQADVRQAAKDLQEAMSKGDMRRVNNILQAYNPKSKMRMTSMTDAKTISDIQDPTKYFEWQYAQYKVLKDLQTDYMGPLQNYNKAKGMIASLKGMKKSQFQNYDGTELAQTLLSAVPISYNGKNAQLTLDKMGNVDWIALAKSVNDGIPLSIREQQEILSNTYDAIYNDPNIQNFTSVIELLNKYLPEIANARSPYGETHFENDEWGGVYDNDTQNVKIPLRASDNNNSLPLMPASALINSHAFTAGRLVNDLDESIANNKGSLVKGTVDYVKKHPELFDTNTPKSHGSTNNAAANKYTRNGKVVGDGSADDKKNQKDYASTYDRNAAKPTQVIINIDKLANFDKTSISKDSNDRAITEAIETKIAEAISMLSAQILTTASSTISQGV